MLNSDGFDLWADGYDQCVGLCDEENEYPFAGYKAVLGKIYETVRRSGPSQKILDIGFGTAVLTARLYEFGCVIFGVDFSKRMVEIASQKMPDARLFTFNFHQGLPPEVEKQKFNLIISTYALHHLTDAEKIPYLLRLWDLLLPGGSLLIGDIAFPDRAALEECKNGCGSGWDDSEYYFVFDEIEKLLPGKIRFEPVSHCAGILTLTR